MIATTRQEATVLDMAPAQSTQVPALRSDSSALTQAIIQAAQDPNVNLDKMERLLSMHERITARDSEQRFNDAMAEAQSRMGRIAADAVNPQTRSKYATYAQLDRHVRPIYTSCGFSLSFDQGDGAPEGHVRVLCYVSNAGHTRTYHADIPSDGKGAKGNDVMTKTHAVGSGKTYGKRYLLKDIFNIAVGEDDDDGNGAAEGAISETAQGWIDFALSVRKSPDEFKAALRDARAAFNEVRDVAGLKAFNAAVA